MTVAKPVTAQNTAAFTKRWQEAIASQNMTDMVPAGSWTNIVGLATVFEKAVSNRSDLRIEFVDRVLEVLKTGVEGAVLNQIKLVWEYSSLKSVQYTDTFIKSHCRALEKPAVLDQAVLLSERWNAALMTDKNLPYSRVRDPNSHNDLTHSHYPNLYYAAITYAKVHKMIGENFQMSASNISAHVALIDKYIRKTAKIELGELSEEAKEKLMKLGYPVSRRRRHGGRQSDDEDSDTEEPPSRQRRH